MRTAKLTIGVKTPFEFSIDVVYSEAETLAEVKAQALDEQYIVDAYVRADRIMFQERSNARDTLREALGAIVKADSKIKSEQQLTAQQRAALRAAVQRKIDSFKRSSSRRNSSSAASTNVVTITQSQYDSMSEVVRAALTAQHVIFNVLADATATSSTAELTVAAK